MKTILITGASSGIGKACAEKLAGDNKLILCARNRDMVESISSGFTDATAFKVDVRCEEDVKNLFRALDQENIIPDVLINSAGLALGLEELEESATKDWDEMIDTNIKGLLLVSKFALRRMKGVGHGHIVNIGSIAGINSYARGVVYAATKAAVKSISDGLRKEVVTHAIKITNIQPGLVDTNFSAVRFYGDANRAKKVYEGINPLKAEDIADIIKYVIEVPEHVQINERECIRWR